MLRRLALLGIALGFVAAAAAIATLSVNGVGASSRPAQMRWTGGRQSLPNRVNASPTDSDMSEDAQDYFGSSSADATNARVPLRLANGSKIEAGIRTDGAQCFDVSTPGRSQGGACGKSVDTSDISGVIHYAIDQPTVFSGLAGDNVTAVDVNTDQGFVPATLQNGAFYASIPNGAKIQGWVISLADGSKTTKQWPPAPPTTN